jgi:hypothetical protein
VFVGRELVVGCWVCFVALVTKGVFLLTTISRDTLTFSFQFQLPLLVAEAEAKANKASLFSRKAFGSSFSLQRIQQSPLKNEEKSFCFKECRRRQ